MIARATHIARSDAAMATGSNAIRALGRLLATVTIARVGGVDAVGLLTITIAVEAILISMLNAMFASPATVLCPGRRSSIRAIIHAKAEQIQAIAGMILGASAVLIGLAFRLEMIFVLALASYFLLASVYQARRSTRLAEFRSRRVLAAELVIAPIGVLGPLAAPWLGMDPLAAFWLAQAFAHGLGFLFLPAALMGEVPRRRATQVARGSILRTGREMMTGSLAASMSSRTHAFLITLVLGQAPVGIYGASNTFAAPIRMLSGAIRGVILPRLAERQRRGAQVRVNWWITTVALISVVAAAWSSAMIAPAAVYAIYGDKFSEAASLVPVCVVLALVGMATSMAACVRQAAGESRYVARIRVIASIVSPVLFAGALFTGDLGEAVMVCVIIEGLCLIAFLKLERSPFSDSEKQVARVGAAASAS